MHLLSQLIFLSKSWRLRNKLLHILKYHINKKFKSLIIYFQVHDILLQTENIIGIKMVKQSDSAKLAIFKVLSSHTYLVTYHIGQHKYKAFLLC